MPSTRLSSVRELEVDLQCRRAIAAIATTAFAIMLASWVESDLQTDAGYSVELSAVALLVSNTRGTGQVAVDCVMDDAVSN